MNKEISKIIFRKNANGTTTKVLVKKVQKNIKLKSKSTTAPKKIEDANTTTKPNKTNKYPTKNTGVTSQKMHTPIVPKKTALSANDLLKRPQSGAAEHKITSVGPTPRRPQKSTANTLSSDTSQRNRKEVFNLNASPPPTGDGRRNKIIVSKKKSSKEEKDRGQFYRRGDKSSYLGNKRSGRKDFHSYEDKQGKEKRVIDELAGVPKEIEITEIIAVKDLAKKLNLKASTVMKKVFNLGVMNLTLNDAIDAESAQIVCTEFGCTAKVVSLLKQTKIELEKGSEKDYTPRAPIVTVMGHVDHGKTSLLDALRGTNIVDSESGKITQHIGATKVKTEKNGEVLFIDTPGHAAFSAMRSRGAKITDIIVLVVSATDGVMPQTEEAIKHAKNSNCGIIVAINKMDLPEANLEKVKQGLAAHEVVSTEWGGDIPFYQISALKKTGLKELLNGILEMSTARNVTGNTKIKAYGYVIESKIDVGKGNTASVVITNGKLRKGESYICGKSTGRIRALFDEDGKVIKEAGPSSAVEIIGLSQPISAGELFQVTENEKESKKIAEKRLELEREEQAARVNLVTMSNLFDKIKEGNIKELRLIIKSDTFGSTEAIENCLENLKNDEIKANIVHSAVGAVNENDINLAFTTDSVIIAFKVTATGKLKKLATEKNIDIKYYNVIYDIIEDIKTGLTDILGSKVNELHRSFLEVKNIFKISGIGKVAGCEVTEGKVSKKHRARITRDSKVVHIGEIANLRHFKDEVKEINTGEECGLSFKNFQNIKAGDQIETFEIETVKKKLELDET